MKKFILIVLVACSFTACPCDDDGPEFTADWLLKNMTDETIVVKSFWAYAHPEPEVVKPGDSYWLYNFYWEREEVPFNYLFVGDPDIYHQDGTSGNYAISVYSSDGGTLLKDWALDDAHRAGRFYGESNWIKSVELQSDGTTQKKWVFELTEDDLKEDVSSGSGESGESR